MQTNMQKAGSQDIIMCAARRLRKYIGENKILHPSWFPFNSGTGSKMWNLVSLFKSIRIRYEEDG